MRSSKEIFVAIAISVVHDTTDFALRKHESYVLKQRRNKINHLHFAGALKLYGKNENQLNSLIYIVNCFSMDI